MPATRDKPDAVLAPRPFLPSGREPFAAFNAMFGPLLGVRAVIARAQGTQYFLTASVHDTILFPSGHDLHPAERYDWFLVSDGVIPWNRIADGRSRPLLGWDDPAVGVKFGYMRDESEVLPPGMEAQIAHARLTDSKVADYQAKVGRFLELNAKTIDLDAADRDEHEALKRELVAFANVGPTFGPMAPRGGVVVPGAGGVVAPGWAARPWGGVGDVAPTAPVPPTSRAEAARKPTVKDEGEK